MSHTTLRKMHPPVGLAAPLATTWVGLDAWPLHRPAELMALALASDAEQARTLHRLAEIGFLPGTVLRVVARGWLRGGPMAVRVGQSTFALRAHEAALLRVRAALDGT
jgi:ferrous iron transport protein A